MDNNIEETATLVTGPLTATEAPGVLAVEPQCPKCTGPMVKCRIGYVGIYGWWLQRESHTTGALGPPRVASSDVSALTCIRCGYTELYATEPQALAPGVEAN